MCLTWQKSGRKETSHKVKTPPLFWRDGVFGMGCLAVTYFRERSAHYHWRSFVSRSCSRWEGVGPKGYCRQAKGVVCWCLGQQTVSGERCIPTLFYVIAAYCCINLELVIALIQGYRVKPHGQLVLVSLTYYYASTPSLSTWWSSTTL